ncbi:5'/3'-nucleotidase SurE [Oscillochloris sp. ZM17-4]|uniref:5'/3'-nucleotidase SurE n=1 Tax=Oscillochloris sp. ZM17-4 TaxID=2866714 RepID=UPI001C73CCBD|nr:5'/3'-nucleotidase SurE [Oscillochloris sp. ZM17-4]MBX0326667.1 5'/3'-nucleotidase SurE [Oscillochloris sp. ZM17-4]
MEGSFLVLEPRAYHNVSTSFRITNVSGSEFHEPIPNISERQGHGQNSEGVARPPDRRPRLRGIAGGVWIKSSLFTPVGCVTAGMLAGACPPADVVVSGINRGLNSGSNVLLSGTVGAAMVAALWGLPAMAVSLQFVGDSPMPWATASWAAVQLFPLLEGLRGRGPLVLNVNVPHIHEIAEVRGFRQTSISDFFYGRYLELPVESEDAEGRRRVAFRFVRERVPAFPESSDDGAIRAGYVSVTPLSPLVGRDDVSLAEGLSAAGLTTI